MSDSPQGTPVKWAECPVCKRPTSKGATRDPYWVECTRCGLRGPWGQTLEEGVAKWNALSAELANKDQEIALLQVEKGARGVRIESLAATIRKEKKIADDLAKALENELNGAIARAKVTGVKLEIESKSLVAYHKSRKEK